MPITTMRAALNDALRLAMHADPDVFLIGEDIAGGADAPGEDDAWGGVFQVTKGLLSKFGRERVVDTPISETAFLGLAIGAANTGLRPIVEIMFVDFFGVCFDQILNNAAKFRYMYGAHAKTPITIRTTYGVGGLAAAQHSQTLYSIFAHIPGIKVVVPSNPYDAKGLLLESIRDDDPVIFFEHKAMYEETGDVPSESYTIPFGKAEIKRQGTDATIVALGRMVGFAEQAADQLAHDGISCTIVDPRTISPLDEKTILECVSATGRLVVADEGHPRCGMAGDIASIVAEKAFADLKAPVRMVTAPHTPVPFAANLEAQYLPTSTDIEAAVRSIIG
ncbi:MAG: alpha-ketoacid dehydrogenase subunit beta [Gammaproteobacteria bacterium]|nr:alpha-ketoacid dehydrogenase subunit beta [Gammaproteobacteria bacterium]